MSHLPPGDRGQRYEVWVTVRETGAKMRMGWTNEADGGGLFESAKICPAMRDPYVVDRETGEVTREDKDA